MGGRRGLPGCASLCTNGTDPFTWMIWKLHGRRTIWNPCGKDEARSQHSTAQHSAAQHSTAQHSTEQRSTAQRSAAQRSAAQRSAAQRSAAQRSAARHSTAQHSTAQDRTKRDLEKPLQCLDLVLGCIQRESKPNKNFVDDRKCSKH